MQRVSLEKALQAAERLGFHVRDEGLLESALARPVTSVFGRRAYVSLPLAAAAQTESLARDNAMFDGNKRMSFLLLNVFLRRNGAYVDASEDDLLDYILGVAQGHLTLQESAEFLDRHLRPWGE